MVSFPMIRQNFDITYKSLIFILSEKKCYLVRWAAELKIYS